MLQNITLSRTLGDHHGENKVTLDLDVSQTLRDNVEFNKMQDIQLFDFYIFSDVIIHKKLLQMHDVIVGSSYSNSFSQISLIKWNLN